MLVDSLSGCQQAKVVGFHFNPERQQDTMLHAKEGNTLHGGALQGTQLTALRMSRVLPRSGVAPLPLPSVAQLQEDGVVAGVVGWGVPLLRGQWEGRGAWLGHLSLAGGRQKAPPLACVAGGAAARQPCPVQGAVESAQWESMQWLGGWDQEPLGPARRRRCWESGLTHDWC